MSDSSSRPVKTRFAPSPTGVPHVGLVRTALYNWAYAKHMGGTFLFRIEDTDATRNTPESYQALLDAFAWLGIDTDEGVIAGGDNGPYRQSERTLIYTRILNELVNNGYVYESFSTKDDIETRNTAAGRAKHLGYDNHDRNLTETQRDDLRAAGVPSVYRMRVPEKAYVIEDLVRGTVTFPVNSFPDFVVARGDGSHLYAFVNAIDDALMGVTHVLRGEDLLASTPRQLVIYEALIALGITDFIPEFGHLPYIMGEGNQKMSKRDPKSNLFNLKRDGFIAPGLLNYLALLGWSIASDRDVFTMGEMIEKFDVRHVNANPARFDELKAAAINAEHIRMLDDDTLFTLLLPVLSESNMFPTGTITPAERDRVGLLVPELKTRMRLLTDAIAYLTPVFHALDGDAPHPTADATAAVTFAKNIVAAVADEDFTAAGLETAFLAALDGQTTFTHKNLWRPVRFALTHSKVSLPLYPLMVAIGKDEVLRRLVA